MRGRPSVTPALNRNLEEPMDVEVRLADAPITELADADFMVGRDPKATNSFETPHEVYSCDHDDVSIKDGVATVCLPPMSVYAGTFRIRR